MSDATYNLSARSFILRHMPRLLFLLAMLCPGTLAAQQGALSPAFTASLRADDRAQAALRQDAGRLWGVRMDTVPVFLVSGDTAYMRADPDQPGYRPIGNNWWTGPLPAGISPSNTALDWAGRRWAMALLPLPDDSLAAERLLIHERWHVVQPRALPLPTSNEFGPSAQLLEQPAGRTWLLLEWRALATALSAQPGSRAEQRAVHDALLFRAARYSADTAEATRERLLDLSEGMAEYSGWKLSRSPVSDLVHALRETAPSLPTYARAFPYYTGPAYGILLDRRAPRWIGALRDTMDLQLLMARTLTTGDDLLRWLTHPGANAELGQMAERAGASYGLAEVRAKETARWTQHERELAALTARYVDAPALILRPTAVRVSFNPNRITALEGDGTVYGGLLWKTDDGAELSAPDGALIDPEWKEIRVPLGDAVLTPGALAQATSWRGDGWTLTLPAGWLIRIEGKSRLVSPP